MLANKRIWVIFLVLISLTSWGQSGTEKSKIGEISFVSGTNYYVKIPSGNLLQTGDTLFLLEGGNAFPVLIVKQKSSLSCLTEKITDRDLTKGVVLYAPSDKLGSEKPQPEIIEESVTQIQLVTEDKSKVEELAAGDLEKKDKKDTSVSKEKKPTDFQLHGRIRAMGMLDLPTDSSEGRNSYRYSVFLKGDHALVQGLSFETYVLFNHTNDVFSGDSLNPGYGIKTYGASLQYKGKQDYWITVGRKINNRLSNIGAIDGIQLEKKLGAFMLGILYGYRPDYSDYSFNSDLPQFGGYLAFEHGKDRFLYRHSFAFVEQQNAGFTDRRFIYGQSSGRITSDLSYFGSLELDLYQKLNGVSSTKLNLSGLYFNMNWQASKTLSLSTSYQARQPIIFYETYQTLVDQLLDRELNQGYRLRANYRPWKFMTISLSGGLRYEKGDEAVAQNYNGVVTLRNVPLKNISSSITATINRSSYFNANIYGVRFNGDLIPGKLSSNLSYRNLIYQSTLEANVIPQHMVELGLDYKLSKNWLLGLNYELLQQSDYPHNRLFLQVRYRF
jgi:hypothetical protein